MNTPQGVQRNDSLGFLEILSVMSMHCCASCGWLGPLYTCSHQRFTSCCQTPPAYGSQQSCVCCAKCQTPSGELLAGVEVVHHQRYAIMLDGLCYMLHKKLHLEVAKQGVAKAAAREHALHRLLNDALWYPLQTEVLTFRSACRWACLAANRCCIDEFT